jgi:hypothetical protein
MTEEMSNFECAKMMVCLDLGIVPTDLDLKDELAKMDDEEARKSKRKFRKLRRKQMKKLEYVKSLIYRKQLALHEVKKDINLRTMKLLQDEG